MSLAQDEDQRTYLTILDRYAAGHCGQASLRLRQLSEEQMKQGLKFESGPAWTVLPLPEQMRVHATIIMLHTEAAFDAFALWGEPAALLNPVRGHVERMTAAAAGGSEPLIHERDRAPDTREG